MELTRSPFPWSASGVPSTVSSSSSSVLSFPSCGGGFDELPFSLEDLPPEIRNKIDDIIENNEDLSSQLEAIDELLFADRPLSKLDFGTKFDIGSESGIGSDSDSGNGILPSSDPPTSSSSVVFCRPSEQDVDDFISRLIVPPPPPRPPHPPRPTTLLTSGGQNHDHPVFRSSSSSLLPGDQSSVSSIPMVSGHSRRSEALPLPPPPVFGNSRRQTAAEQESIDDQIRVFRSGETFHVTLDVPHGPWSTPSPTPRHDGSLLSVSRILVTTDGNDALQATKGCPHDAHGSAAAESNSLQKSSDSLPLPSSSRSSSRGTELFAWGDVDRRRREASISPQSTIRSSQSSDSSAKSLSSSSSAAPGASATGGDVPRRPSQLSLESSQKQTRMLWKQEESDTDSVNKYISTPSRYSKGFTGSTVDLRRKKWRPTLEPSSKGKTETKVGKWNAEGRPTTSDDERVGHEENVEGEEMKRTASDDDFSSLVQLRGKNGKPAQMVRIDGRTLKAQSMLSLYDPSFDAKDKAKGKKSTKKEGKGSDPKNRLSALFQGKLGFNKKSKDLVTRHSYDSRPTDKADSETELHRSDYLHSTPPPPPPPPASSNRCSIPSPSLYPLMEPSSSSSLRMRSPSRPGNISDIFRMDVRDLEVDDDRPSLTFNTFRGQIEPIRWREEERNSCSGTTSRWTPEPSTRKSLPPANSSPSNLQNGSKSLHSSNSLQLQNDSLLFCAQNSSNKILSKMKSISDEGEHPKSTCILIVNGMPTKIPPMVKVTASNPTPSRSYSGEVLRTSDGSSVADSSPPRVFANGLNGSSSGLQLPSAAHDLLGTRISRHQRGNPETPNVALAAIDTLPKKATDAAAAAAGDEDEKASKYNEERMVLQTTYDDDASACDRAVSDTRRMLSSLLADRKWILSATHSTSGSSFDLFRTRKELLAANCRQLVTDAKLMVAGATRSRHDLIRSLTAALHTFARTFESCRLVVTALPIDGRRKTLLDEVLKVGDIFLSALWSATVAAGRGPNDPAMEQLMQHTTELAHSLGRLVNTIKSLVDRT